MVAYDWFQKQSPEVQKLATTPDLLVGLYLRTQRQKASAMEQDAPVSTQLFKQDLKRLSKGLEAFSDAPPPHSAAPSHLSAQGAIDLRDSNGESEKIFFEEHQTGAASVASPPPRGQSYAMASNSSKTFVGPTSGGRASAMSESMYHQYYRNTAQPMTYDSPAISHAGQHPGSPGNMQMNGNYTQGQYSADVYAQSGAAALAVEPNPMNYGYSQEQNAAQIAAPVPQMPPPSSTNNDHTRAYHHQPAPAHRSSAVDRMQQVRRESQTHNYTANPGSATQPLPWNQPAHTRTTQAYSPAHAAQNANVAGMLSLFDEKTQEAIRLVTKELNLGSEREALRLLVSLGYKRVRPLIEEFGEELDNLSR